jgi:F-type H+-transporting ATPase subunit b
MPIAIVKLTVFRIFRRLTPWARGADDHGVLSASLRAQSLDDRASGIKAEIDEARKLKEEAGQLLADYERKRREAETEAQAIISDARAEAERMTIESKAKIDEFIARRIKMAEAKIAQAEAQAAADVRRAAADAAIAAAERILRQAAKGELANELVAKGIEDVRKKLN